MGWWQKQKQTKHLIPCFLISCPHHPHSSNSFDSSPTFFYNVLKWQVMGKQEADAVNSFDEKHLWLEGVLKAVIGDLWPSQPC